MCTFCSVTNTEFLRARFTAEACIFSRVLLSDESTRATSDGSMLCILLLLFIWSPCLSSTWILYLTKASNKQTIFEYSSSTFSTVLKLISTFRSRKTAAKMESMSWAVAWAMWVNIWDRW